MQHATRTRLAPRLLSRPRDADHFRRACPRESPGPNLFPPGSVSPRQRKCSSFAPATPARSPLARSSSSEAGRRERCESFVGSGSSIGRMWRCSSALALVSIVATGAWSRERATPRRIWDCESFTADRLSALAAVMTLSFVPDLLNILPMYVVLLALVPLAMAASRISPWLAVAASAALWGLVQETGLNLPAGGAPGRMWFFDPFAWQLMFFTGFAFGMRWLNSAAAQSPRASSDCRLRRSRFRFQSISGALPTTCPTLASIRDWLVPDGLAATTQLHLLRYAHFLCLAYVALSAARPLAKDARLADTRLPILTIGQTVARGLRLERDLGLDRRRRARRHRPRLLSVAAVNLAGFCAIFAVAQGRSRLTSPALEIVGARLRFRVRYRCVGPGIGRPAALRRTPSEQPRVSPFDPSLAKQPTERSATSESIVNIRLPSGADVRQFHQSASLARVS